MDGHSLSRQVQWGKEDIDVFFRIKYTNDSAQGKKERRKIAKNDQHNRKIAASFTNTITRISHFKQLQQ